MSNSVLHRDSLYRRINALGIHVSTCGEMPGPAPDVGTHRSMKEEEG